MGRFKLSLIAILIFTLVSISFGNQLPIPQILNKGDSAPEDVFYFTEDQFKLILQWRSYYKFKEIEWKEKEIIYNETIKDLAKRTRVPFFKSTKFGIILGISFIVLSVWAVGQLD